jgi:putative tricarboxylic transport membrane protein
MNTRTFGHVVSFAAALLSPAIALGQGAWKPDRPVDIIVGTSPGNSADRMARFIQKIWQEKKLVEAPVSVSNRPGGSNSVAWSFLQQRPGDGHFLLVGTLNLSTTYLIDPQRPGYKDFTPLAIMFHEYTSFAVKADSSIKNGKDLFERLKKDPSSVSFAVSSVAGSNHLSAVMTLKAAGVDIKKLRLVSFDSGSKAVTAVLGGHLDVVSISLSVPRGHLESGAMRTLGVTAPRRLEGLYANVPTWQEQGVKVNFSSYRAMFGAKGLSDAQVAYWERMLAAVDQDEAWRASAESELLDRSFTRSRDSRKYLDEFENAVKPVLSELGLIK